MKISIITLFPQAIEPILNFSILKRAQEKGKVRFEVVNLRRFGIGKHKTVDDAPYGGGAGMVIKADVLAKAINSISHQFSDLKKRKSEKAKIILASASGKKYDQRMAKELAKEKHIIIIAGHYEGVDERIINKYVDMEISIGDYVLTGGEIPCLTITDGVVRLIPGVLEKEQAIKDESFENNLLEYPQYTRPEVFEGEKVPEILLSGNHKKIEDWRKLKALEKTKKVRPDLLSKN